MQTLKAGKKRSAKRPSARSVRGERRSVCPVSCSLDLLGDRWTLLVVRDLLLGRTRFKEFMESPEGIPTNILTERLSRLVDHQIVRREPVSEGSKRLCYRLTKKGEALSSVLLSLKEWGLKWQPETAARMKALDRP